ncbi:NAD-dependent epimerase/dehydratase family protein [Seonamhaeicola sp. ML3]|uniref:NAD-dependent epimerase/dehydratase family protein n=1 Tax=Seonamhaeicola sp. ML3 TaxID=2937786 RepID=UPI00200F37C2|nr:NAD-dependent epimerase/dehydratase family protein [Seonamhaeicola sp. ML3]
MILVTGGTGLVGAHLLYRLANKDNHVRAIYRNERKIEHVKNVFSCYSENYHDVFKKIEWVKADILDIPALTDVFKDIEYVYHCAAFVSFEPDKYLILRKTNIEGTANVVNLCCTNNIKKLCYVSSIATLGESLNESPINEETIWNAEADNSVYAITKYGAEIEVWRASQEGLDVVVVNPGVIIGAGIWKYGSGSLFRKAAKGLKHYTNGSIGLVSVIDVVDIMVDLMLSPIVNERFVLVAENWSYKRFFSALSKAVGKNPPKHLAKPLLLKFAWKIDWLKTKLTGKRRRITKHIVSSISTKKNYSSDKVKKTLNYSFKPIEESIIEVGAIYLKQDR